LARLEAEGYSVLCKRYDQVHAGKAAGLDLRPLTTQEVSNHLVDFGLDPSFSTYTKINGLSGGQKSKLVFAAAMWSKPHVLVLDEPTNYLDRETLEALKSALRRFKGAFVVVSHNRDFITGLCTEEWHVKSGRVTVTKVVDNDDDLVDPSSSSSSQEAIDPIKAAEEAALIAKGAQILGGGQEPITASGSAWAKGTVTNANKVHTVTLVKDEKGRTLSKKEQRLLEKKQKALLTKDNGVAEDAAAASSSASSAAEKKAKREAKKLLKEGMDINKLDPKFNAMGLDAYAKKQGEGNVALSIKELEAELEAARVNAARIRGEEGGYFGSISTENFTLPNPVSVTSPPPYSLHSHAFPLT
jgi:ABC-type multidrug transport system ATPase subunit